MVMPTDSLPESRKIQAFRFRNSVFLSGATSGFYPRPGAMDYPQAVG